MRLTHARSCWAEVINQGQFIVIAIQYLLLDIISSAVLLIRAALALEGEAVWRSFCTMGFGTTSLRVGRGIPKLMVNVGKILKAVRRLLSLVAVGSVGSELRR